MEPAVSAGREQNGGDRRLQGKTNEGKIEMKKMNKLWELSQAIMALVMIFVFAGMVRAGGIEVFSASRSAVGSVEIAIGDRVSGQLITTNTITVRDQAGEAIAFPGAVTVWMSSTELGAPTTNNTEGLTLTGTEIKEDTANALVRQLTTTNGVITATVTASAVVTTYINAAAGVITVSEEIELVP